MNVLFLSPGYPDEMAGYVRGLAQVGAHIYAVGDHPKESLPAETRACLTAYLQVPGIMDEGAVIDRVLGELAQNRVTIDRVESLWEPLMLLAARLRETLGVPGMSVEQTVPFRDKEVMKQVLDRGGHPHPASRGAAAPRTRCGRRRSTGRLPAHRQAHRRGGLARTPIAWTPPSSWTR